MEWINALVQGTLLGGFYALLAAGLSFIFGVMRIVNLAHGALAVLAAYLGITLTESWHWPLALGILVVLPVMGGVGYLVQTAVLNRALARGGLAPVLATFGVAVVVANLLQEVYSADSRTLQAGALSTASVEVATGLSVGALPLVTALAGVAVVAALQSFLSHTRVGRAMRATSDDPETARLMGVDDRRVYALATAMAVATVGLAGLFLGMRTQFSPTYGDLVLIFAFEAVIIGGLGSLWGTLLGGLILGVAQSVGAQADPAYGVLVGHLVFLTILATRPGGLLPKVVPA